MDSAPRDVLPTLSRLGSVRRLPGSMVDILISSFFINLVGLALPVVILQIYDRIIPNTATGTLALLLLGVATALTLETLLRLGRSFISGWVGARFEHIVGGLALERLLTTSVAEFEQDGAGEHLERLEGLNILKEFYSGQALIAVFDLPFSVVFLTLIWYLGGNLVLVVLTLIALFSLSAVLVGLRLRRAIGERTIADDRRFNFIIEVLSGIHTIKALAMEPQMLRRYERLQETCAEHGYKVTAASATAMSTGTIFSYLSLFAIAGFGSTHVIDGTLTVGGLAACTMLSGRAMQPLQRAMGLWTRFQTVRLAKQRLQRVFDLAPEYESDLPELPADIEPVLDLVDVSFRYNDKSPLILDTVSLHVAHGEAIGISGGNASGKTTLLYLLMGALKPTTGTVLIGGQPIQGFDIESIYRTVAYLPQEGVLFNGTILDNLTMFRPELAKRAIETARMLGLDAVVSRMPSGYETMVGDGAHDFLPRGITQRLAISRALATRPRIILFDEANMAIDAAGDNRLREVMEWLKGRCTLVLVTRRPSFLKLADKVYDLKDGHLALRETTTARPGPRPVPSPPPQLPLAPGQAS